MQYSKYEKKENNVNKIYAQKKERQNVDTILKKSNNKTKEKISKRQLPFIRVQRKERQRVNIRNKLILKTKKNLNTKKKK